MLKPLPARRVACQAMRSSTRASALEAVRPARAWVPFYICDAALQAFEATNVPVEFYAVDEAFDPVLPRGVPDGECVMYVNYFGLKTKTATSVVSSYSSRAIVDDTHAFFATGYAGAWSFNSALLGRTPGTTIRNFSPQARRIASQNAGPWVTRLSGNWPYTNP